MTEGCPPWPRRLVTITSRIGAQHGASSRSGLRRLAWRGVPRTLLTGGGLEAESPIGASDAAVSTLTAASESGARTACRASGLEPPATLGPQRSAG